MLAEARYINLNVSLKINLSHHSNILTVNVEYNRFCGKLCEMEKVENAIMVKKNLICKNNFKNI